MKRALIGYSGSAHEAVGTAVFTVASDECVGADGMVLVGNIETCSTCASSLLPFVGSLHIGYVPSNGRVLGLSKLARIAEVYARRLQTPAALADAVANAVHEQSQPEGVAVRLQAKQLGPHGFCESEHTSCLGSMDDPSTGRREEFDSLLQMQLLRRYSNCADSETGKQAVSSNASSLSSVQVNTSEMSPQAHLCEMKSRRLKSLLKVDGVQRAAQHQRMCDAAEQMLRYLGVPEENQILRAAADGYVRSLLDATAGYELSAAKLVPPQPVDRPKCNLRGRELVYRTVEINSTCEHHLLPFYGSAVVGVPLEAASHLTSEVVQALVDVRALRLQVQERLTEEAAEQLHAAACAIANASDCDALVAIEASHMCMVARGVEKAASCTSSVAAFGSLRSSPKARASALESAMALLHNTR